MVTNVEVRPYEGESVERLLKRFSKRCRKEALVSEVFNKMYHKTKSQKRRAKRQKNAYLRRKKQRR